LLWVIQKDLDNYFVSASLGPRDYAIYAVGWIDVPLLTLILESVVSVMIVRISSLQKEDRKADIRYLTAAATNRMAALQFPLFMMLWVAGHDLIVLLYTRAYERSANIFLVSILLLPAGVLLLDPIVRAYKGLRNFLLVVRICIFVALFCVLAPVIHHFGMMGAAITAVAAQILERLIIAWRAARAVEASWHDLKLYADLFKITAISMAAGAVAYVARNLISPALLIPRIIVVGLCIAAIYLPAMFVFRLPGVELLTKERVLSLVRSTLGRLKGARA
jgi:O-antigen/teichoic acid export membrane protein